MTARRPLPPRRDDVPPRAPLPAGATARRERPSPGPMRFIVALAGLASASAVGTAIVAAPPAPGTAASQVAAAVPAEAVVHVVRYVQLAPGQTAPPNAVVQQAAAPAPRVVTVTTRQSGVVK